jgi:flagellar basal body-associated protein FliL
VAEAEAAEAPEEEEEKKKGGIKKLLIKVIPLLLVAYFIATKTVLAPPPPTPAQLAIKAKVDERALEIKCAHANHKTAPKPLDPKTGEEISSSAKKSSESEGETEAAEGEHEVPEPTHAAGPILKLDAVTINLQGGGYLKVGIGLQFPHGAGAAGHGATGGSLEDGNPGVPALDHVLSEMRKKSKTDLGPKELEHLREDLGYTICVNPKLNAGGQIETLYFTDFVYE